MAVATPLTLLLCLVLGMQVLGQRQAARDATCDCNSPDLQTARLLARLEGRINTQLEAMQDGMQRLEDKLDTAMTDLKKTTKAMEDKLDTAMSLHAEEIEKSRAMMTDLKNTTKERCGPPQYRTTCQDYYDNGQRSSGTYRLLLEDGQEPIEVYCNMTNGTGWVVFQRREDGSVDFYRNWTSYEEGFGNLEGEFWLGNRNIHRLTRAGLTQLRVDLQAWNGSSSIVSYSHFSVGDARSSYTLSVSGYSGTAGDSLEYNNGQKFTTFDRDEDTWSGGNCAQDRKGAWWHGYCTNSHLNGVYGTRGSSGSQYVTWYHWLGFQSLQRTELKLK